MELLKQIVFGVLFLGAAGAWYWYKYLRHGGVKGYMDKQLGLAAGEKPTAMWMCYYHVEISTAQAVGEALVGVRTRGINVMLALTNTGSLTIGSNENDNPPMRFQRGQVQISEYPSKPKNSSLAGPNGLEATCVLQITSAHEEPIRLEIVRSGYEAVANWARAAAA
jgi:hypothetical protein